MIKVFLFKKSATCQVISTLFLVALHNLPVNTEHFRYFYFELDCNVIIVCESDMKMIIIQNSPVYKCYDSVV